MSVKFQEDDRVIVMKGANVSGFPYDVGDVGHVIRHRGESGVDVKFLKGSSCRVDNDKLELHRPCRLNQFNIDYAKNYFDCWNKTRAELVKQYTNPFVTEEMIADQLGWIDDSVTYRIMSTLDLKDDKQGKIYWEILQGVTGKVEFEEVIKNVEKVLEEELCKQN